MHTERTIMLGEENLSITISELEEKERQSFWQFVELTRHLQEIRQLYLLFKYDLDRLLGTYELMSNGQVSKSNCPATTDEDYIAINALVTNFISAGKTLTEAMKNCIKGNFAEEDPMYIEFMQSHHDIYDHRFPYRLLVRLRDHSQHGHLPVSQEGAWYGFDLYQILNKPHYRHNPKMRHEIEGAVELVMDKHRQIPKLSLAMTLAEYIANLLGLYSAFWGCFALLLNSLYKECQQIEMQYPQNRFEFEGVEMFCYDVEEGMAHTITSQDDPKEMLVRFKGEAESVYKEYEKAWDDLKEGVKFVPLEGK